MFISRLRSVSLIFVLVSFLALPVNALESVHFSFALATLESGLTDAAGVAVDGSGNVYVVDSSSTSVLKVPVGCRFAGCIVTLGSGFNNAQGIAVDGSGDVFVADTYNNAVKEIVAVNGIIPASPTINLLGNGFSFNEPWGIAVDTSGNVYVADYGNTGVNSNMVYELPASGGYQQVKALGSGFFGPTGIAVDASGNVYVSDIGSNTVYEILAARSSIYAPYTAITLGSNFNYPYGVAVDGSGNVFVSDTNNNLVKEIVAGTGGAASPEVVAARSRGGSRSRLALCRIITVLDVLLGGAQVRRRAREGARCRRHRSPGNPSHRRTPRGCDSGWRPSRSSGPSAGRTRTTSAGSMLPGSTSPGPPVRRCGR